MTDSDELDTTRSLTAVVDGFARRRILVVGDLMLDRFVYGDVARISPEAPAPVILTGASQDVPGGAGNVACGIAALGARCDLVAVVGDDEAGTALARALGRVQDLDAALVTRIGGTTTVKTRYVANLHNTHLLRADREDCALLDTALEAELIARVRARIAEADAVILSDYSKGVLSPRVLSAVREIAGGARKPVVVDPKGCGFERYAGFGILTPNLAELGQALGRKIAKDDDAVASAGQDLLETIGCDALLVTRGERGVTALQSGRPAVTYPACAKAVVDISGAGDTVVASFTLALASGAGLAEAARLANAAAGLVVAKRCTATVSAAELRDALRAGRRRDAGSKILRDLSQAAEAAAAWRRQGLVVGFTNGCFDLVHPGHVALLEQARGRCDRLIVGVNTDASVRRLKGAGRPIQDETSRAIVLAAFARVDGVVLFDEPTPLRLIEAIRPERLFKGADYKLEAVVGHDVVHAYGGRVELIDIVPDASTTRLVAAARQPR